MDDEASMAYAESLRVLENELAVVASAFGGLEAADWAARTLLEPVTPGKPRWTLLELAGRLDISIGITGMLLEDPRPGPPELDEVSFFIFPSRDVATEFYDYAFTMVEGKTPAEMPRTLSETFSRSLQEARATSPETVGSFPGFEPYPSIRLDDWMSSRIVEAVVHGMDLTDALDRSTTVTADGISHTARLFDDLLARQGEPGRPLDLGDDLARVRAAAGRDHHGDPRLPLIG